MTQPFLAIDLTAVKLRWERWVVDGHHFIDEHIEGFAGFTRFGPIPDALVWPVIDERKAYFEVLVAKYSRNLVGEAERTLSIEGFSFKVETSRDATK